MLVQDVVVLDVRAQGERGGGLAPVQEDPGARRPVQRRHAVVQLLDGVVQRPLVERALLGDQHPALLPGGQDGEHRDADDQRKPRPVRQLGEVGGEEQQVNREQDGSAREDEPERFLPLLVHDVEEQQRGDRDRAGDGHAVGVRERGRAAEREHEREHGDEQRPVDPRDVDLADPRLRGVLDPQPRQVAELRGLLGERERAGDDRLRGDDGRGGGQDHHRDQRPVRRQQVERVADCAGSAQDQRALPEVVEDASGEDQEQPRPGDRPAAEVPHVRVQGLGAGDGQHHRRQREERRAEVAEQEFKRVRGEQRLQDGRVADHAADAQGADHREPDGHHRPEQPPDDAGCRTAAARTGR